MSPKRIDAIAAVVAALATLGSAAAGCVIATSGRGWLAGQCFLAAFCLASFTVIFARWSRNSGSGGTQ